MLDVVAFFPDKAQELAKQPVGDGGQGYIRYEKDEYHLSGEVGLMDQIQNNQEPNDTHDIGLDYVYKFIPQAKCSP